MTRAASMMTNLCVIISLLVLPLVSSVDKSNFKTCSQAGFCRRHRENTNPQSWHVVPDSLTTNDDVLSLHLRDEHSGVTLLGTLTSLIDGQVFRMTFKELESQRVRFNTYDHVISPDVKKSKFSISHPNDNQVDLSMKDGKNQIKIQYKPFRVDVYSDGQLVMSANQQEKFLFEQNRPKDDERDDCKQDGCWEETFKSHTDTKPFGPMSVGMDVTFVDCEHVYGIPEHADSFALKNTKGVSEPYRLYNLDVFEYEVDSPMALYGSIPMMIGHSAQRTVAMFWLNPSETWIDIDSSSSGSFFSNLVSNSEKHKQTHWISETGLVDVLFMFGPTPNEVMAQNAKLTGTTPMPPIFSIGYHQSRWNYFTQGEVNEVDILSDKNEIPMDAIWLDIEYTEGRSKKYFTWDPNTFNDPKTLVSNLTSKGRTLVTIIDPHIKKDNSYSVFNEATNNGYFVKSKDGNDYEGWCWPGASFWPDFLSPKVFEWWGEKFESKHFPGFDGVVGIWNDMNEPSVFNGPEVTMPKDNKHHDGFEHRDIHNIYGYLMTKSTHTGLVKYRPNQRPFILTRSYFAGSQKHCAAWTGDNMSKWEHLRMPIPMILSSSVVGMAFIGADVPGFFFNPESEELVIRWYQLGTFQPFHRGHAHIDTKRREPWAFSDTTKNIIKQTIELRYSYMPFIYTLFHENEVNGLPINRPLWLEFPKDVNCFAIDDSFMLGDALLVAPVSEKGATSVTVYFPGDADTSWISRESYLTYRGGNKHTIDAPINSLPHFQRSGTIIAKRERIRRSVIFALNDPLSLDIFLDKNGKAQGQLYLDDGQSFNYQKGEFVYGTLKMEKKILEFDMNESGKYEAKNWLERVRIFGWNGGKVARIVSQIGDKTSQLQYNLDEGKRVLTIRKPAFLFTQHWKIKIT